MTLEVWGTMFSWAEESLLQSSTSGTSGLTKSCQVYYLSHHGTTLLFTLFVLTGTTARIVARKVAVDAVVFAVPYYTAFYVCLNYLSNVPIEESLEELRKKLVPTILSTTAFWVPAQTVNFRFISPRYRVFYLAGCTFVEFNILAIFKKLKF